MATRTESRGAQSNGNRPDTLYAFIAGLYVAILLTPIATLGISMVSANGATLYVSFLVSVTLLGIIAGWFISHTAGLAVRLGRHDMVWLLAVFPFVPFVGVFAAAGIGISPPSITVVLAMVTMIGGMVTGLPLVTMSRNRYTNAALAGTTEITEWEGRWPQRWRQMSYGAMIMAMVGGAVGMVAEVVFGVDWAGSLYLLLFVWAPLAGAANLRTFRVTDAGLVVDRPMLHRFRPWTSFTGYSLGDEALVIHRKRWWRQNLRCDRDDIDDIDAVTAALDTVMPDRPQSFSKDI